jgi:hypothetical protein
MNSTRRHKLVNRVFEIVILAIWVGSHGVADAGDDIRNSSVNVYKNNPIVFGAVADLAPHFEYYRLESRYFYEWMHPDSGGAGRWVSISLDVPNYKVMQERYSTMDHTHGNYNRFIQDDPYLFVLVRLAQELETAAIVYDLDPVELALSFVQSFPYQDVNGYQRYAVETMIDGQGDCSDKSVLLGGIFAVWNIPAAFLFMPGHLAVGVAATFRQGDHFVMGGVVFYYCETTNPRMRLGECPDRYTTVGVVPISTIQ